MCLHTNRKSKILFNPDQYSKQTPQPENFLAKLYLFKFKLDIFRAREATTNIKQIHIEAKFSLKWNEQQHCQEKLIIYVSL